ncbi:MAG: hypothetical protein ACOC9B_07615 [Chloroflexota bacterium]
MQPVQHIFVTGGPAQYSQSNQCGLQSRGIVRGETDSAKEGAVAEIALAPTADCLSHDLGHDR